MNQNDLYKRMIQAWKKSFRGGVGLLGYLLLGLVIITIGWLLAIFVPKGAERFRQWTTDLVKKKDLSEKSEGE